MPRRGNLAEVPLRRTTMKKYLIAGLLVAGFVTPAVAASEYYVA